MTTVEIASQLLWVKYLAQSLVFRVICFWVEDLSHNLVPLGLALWEMHDVAQMLDMIWSTSEWRSVDVRMEAGTSSTRSTRYNIYMIQGKNRY